MTGTVLVTWHMLPHDLVSKRNRWRQNVMLPHDLVSKRNRWRQNVIVLTFAQFWARPFRSRKADQSGSESGLRFLWRRRLGPDPQSDPGKFQPFFCPWPIYPWLCWCLLSSCLLMQISYNWQALRHCRRWRGRSAFMKNSCRKSLVVKAMFSKDWAEVG